MTDKSILIIGAGIAGLSAGCYGQMNGYRTRIFELHDKPGGLCTSWTRQGYTFDGCIHWLMGSRPGSPFNRVWAELGAVQGRRFVNHEEFVRVEGADGKALIIYTDLGRLERHMKELAPADARVIAEFIAAARTLSRMEMPVGKPQELVGPLPSGGLKMLPRMLPLLPALRKWRKVSVQEFAARFTDSFLREAFVRVFDLPDFPMLAVLMTLGAKDKGDAGYPIGGSLAFARAIERRYRDLGGEVQYRSRVDRILVENQRAVGVRLTDGSEHRADMIISAADGHATIFHMLEGQYVNDEIRGYYDTLPIFQPIVQVSLGVARALSGEPHSVSYPLAEPIVIAGEEHRRFGFTHYGFDPTLAPAGKSVVIAMFPSRYESWKQLQADRAQYEAEKQRIADAVIAQLDQRFPGLAGQVEAVDVATPLTTERYTGNWQGSMEGWLITTQTISMMMGKGMSKTLPGLESFYLIGQWVQPGGGLPPAAQSGRDAIQLICHRDRRPFVTATP
jgi:phytoene dehydrogenase-like protein